MQQSIVRTLVRISVSALAVLVLVAPAAAKPKGDRPAKAQKHGVSVTKREHGKAVRIAAKCPVEGKAHGQLVRSIAKNKSATVEDAEAACAAALELQEGEDEELEDDDELEEGEDEGGDEGGDEA